MTDSSIPHHYPLAMRNSGLMSAIGLMMISLPYALMRFAVLLSFSAACIIWIMVMIGGAVWLGSHVAGAFGFVWFIGCAMVVGWFWAAILRYMLHLIECGHVAVLTELIVYGKVGNGAESMFAYGKRIVTEKFGQVNVLFAMNLLVRGVVNAVHNTIQGIGNMLPIPGIESIANLITAALRAATRYMDKVIFSYNLATGTENPWAGARDGLVYYAQNVKPVLRQSVWIVIFEYVLTAVMWVALLIPAAMVTAILPSSVLEMAGIVTVLIAILFAFAARGAFLKPLFLIMVMVRFHVLIENETINQEWVARLDQLSQKFRDLGHTAEDYLKPAPPPADVQSAPSHA